jgi:hypothetical protein
MERTFNALNFLFRLRIEKDISLEREEEASLYLKKLKSIKGMPHCKDPFKIHYTVKMRLSFQLKCDE